MLSNTSAGTPRPINAVRASCCGISVTTESRGAGGFSVLILPDIDDFLVDCTWFVDVLAVSKLDDVKRLLCLLKLLN